MLLLFQGDAKLLKKKWFLIFSIFLLIAFTDEIFLMYNHYSVTIMEWDICRLCSSKWTFIDDDAVAISKYALLGGIPVVTWGIFANLFLILFLSAVFYLKRESLKDYLSIIYPILLFMLFFSVYELFVSLLIIKALCVFCVLFYICATAMTISCKLAVQSNHKDIFYKFYQFFLSIIYFRSKFNVTLIAGTILISSFFALGLDSHVKYTYSVLKAKQIDKQKDRVIELLKEMLP